MESSRENWITLVLEFLSAENLESSYKLIEAHKELMSDEVDSALTQLAEGQKSEDIRLVLLWRRDLLRLCRTKGIREAYDQYKDRPYPPMPRDIEDSPQQSITGLVVAMLNAQTWKERKQIIEDHKDQLLSDAVDKSFSTLLKQYEDDANAARYIKDGQELLVQCRREGIDAAFARRLRVEALIDELHHLNTPQDMLCERTLVEEALTLIDRKQEPEQWAILQLILGKNLLRSPQGSKEENTEQAIAHLEMALEVFTHEQLPARWAQTTSNLGAAYGERIREDQAENLERAIKYAQAALEVYTREDYPEEWAGTQNNLGIAYAGRIQGVRAENQEQAIAHYQHALEVYTPEKFPDLWATVQHNLSNIYKERIRGTHGGSVEQAIARYQQDLERYPRDRFPEEWAHIQHQLGLAYAERIRGNWALNLERAIDAYKLALEIQTREAMPSKWAQTMSNLATTYTERIRGKRTENLKQAITLCEQILDVWTYQTAPMEWADIAERLAVAYYERSDGDRADDLEHTITLLEQIPKVLTRRKAPADWGRVMANLATAYTERIRGDRAQNLEHAIAAYKQVLKVNPRDRMPASWAQIVIGLAATYSERIRGNRAQNLERSISLYKKALEVITQQSDPVEWARIMHNLGNAYRRRVKGEHGENLEQAITLYQQALQVRTRYALPFKWAQTMANLGLVYSEREKGEPEDNIDQAIRAYQQALEVQTLQTTSFVWAETTFNLANAYFTRKKSVRKEDSEQTVVWYGQKTEDIEQAIKLYKEVLEVYTRQAIPLKWARTMGNLAAAYLYRSEGNTHENLERAISHCIQALEVYAQEQAPANWKETVMNVLLMASTRLQDEQEEPEPASQTLMEQARHWLEGDQQRKAQLQPETPLERKTGGLLVIDLDQEDSMDMVQALSIFEQLRGSDDPTTFLQQHLDLFTEPIIAACIKLLTKGPDTLPIYLYSILTLVANLREESEMALVPSGLRMQIEASTSLEEREDPTSLQEKVKLYQELLKQLNPATTPLVWARLQDSLGLAYSKLFQAIGEGAYAKDAENAYKLALQTRTRNSTPVLWAATTNRLTTLYTVLYERRGETVYAQQAEENCHQIAEVLTQRANQDGWVTNQINLGNIYKALHLYTNEESYARQAETTYNETLNILDQHAHPDAIMIRNNLAILYKNIYINTGEERFALQAESLYQRTLQSVTLETNPSFWVTTQRNLAILYGRMYNNTDNENYAQHAEAAYKQVLRILTRETTPQDWAAIQYNLANLYLMVFNQRKDMHYAQQAIDTYQRASEILTRESIPTVWAGIQSNVANLYRLMYQQTGQEEYAQQAEATYLTSLGVRVRQELPAQRAESYYNLAGLYHDLYERNGEERYAQQAETNYNLALEVYQPQVAPLQALAAAQSLARLYVRQWRWNDAHATYQIALAAAHNQYLTAQSVDERRQLMEGHSVLYRENSICLVHLGKFAEAMVCLDEGRARILGETIGLDEAARTAHGEEGVVYLHEARRILQEQEEAYTAASTPIESSRTEAERREMQRARDRALAELSTAFSNMGRLVQELGLEQPTISAEELIRLPIASETAAVALLLGEESYVLLLHDGSVQAVPLPNFTIEVAIDLISSLSSEVKEWMDAYNSIMQAKQALGQVKEEQRTSTTQTDYEAALQSWQRTMDKIADTDGNYEAGWYFASYLAFNVLPPWGHSTASRAAIAAWKRTIQRTLTTLTEQVWKPLANVLPSCVKHILLIPTGLTALLPIHAATTPQLTVSYVPSLSVWRLCQSRASDRTADSIFIATPANDLFFKQMEMAWLAHQFHEQHRPVVQLARPQATVSAVRDAASGYGLIHFSGHARYNREEPMNSALLCLDGPLTLAMIRREMDLKSARLVTLSACETGVSDILGTGEEYVGLPAGLLEAGSPAVIASLWPVHDVSTAFLMDRFYKEWLKGEEEPCIADALQAAAHWLRSATKAELLAWLAASPVSEKACAIIKGMLEKMIRRDAKIQPLVERVLEQMVMQEGDKVADAVSLTVADEIVSKPEDPPFAEPHYWAAFAAYGAAM